MVSSPATGMASSKGLTFQGCCDQIGLSTCPESGVAFKFIHTADIHLDSPLKSLAMRDKGLAELVGNATRTVLSRLIDLCIAEQVHALLIAGDLYDGAQTSMKTARFLAQELERLSAAEIPVFMIRGNHDSLSKITRELVLPKSVHVFRDKASVHETPLNGHDVAIQGISFRLPHAPDSLLEQFQPPLPGAFNIGMLHTSLGGVVGHDSYAPCSLIDLQNTGFDYWALGHIHKRSVHAGRPTITMPGIPQGRDIGESGAKSVTFVTVNDDGTVDTTERNISVAQFELIEIDCTGLSEWDELVTHISDHVAETRRHFDGEHLILRLRLTGASPMAWRALRDEDLILAQAQNVAASIGTLWIDKIEIQLTDAANDTAHGPISEISDLINEIDFRPEEKRIREEVKRLMSKLPQELRGIFGESETQVDSFLQKEMQLGAREILTRLDGSEEL